MEDNYIFDHGPQPPEPKPAEPAPVPASPAPAVRGGGRTNRGGSWVSILALICSVLALILSVIALLTALREEPEPVEPPPAPPEPVYFQYRDKTLEAYPDLAVNEYDRTQFYFNEAGRAIYTKNGFQAKTGIDVSFYQKDIDWEAVAADGVDFAMIRLGYRGYSKGTLQMDEYFAENIQGALDAGLEVGVYFFSQAVDLTEAEEEAEYVLKALEGYEITYPVAYDWEFIEPGNNARTEGISGQTLTACARIFCQRIREAGYTPAVYFNQDLAYLHYDLSKLGSEMFWLAEYGGAPDFFYDFDLWQYTCTGAVDGIEGEVDLNLDLRPVKELPAA